VTPPNDKKTLVERTKEILEENYPLFEEKDREVTFLLNCLLGIIVTISENEKRKNEVFKGFIDDDFLDLIPEKVGFLKDIPQDHDLITRQYVRLGVGKKEDLAQKSKLWFINRIRNGIAHQNIDDISTGNKWIGIRLWNQKSSTRDFEIEYSIQELKIFALELAKIYLEKK
jgi:hypothetical protein